MPNPGDKTTLLAPVITAALAASACGDGEASDSGTQASVSVGGVESGCVERLSPDADAFYGEQCGTEYTDAARSHREPLAVR